VVWAFSVELNRNLTDQGKDGGLEFVVEGGHHGVARAASVLRYWVAAEEACLRFQEAAASATLLLPTTPAFPSTLQPYGANNSAMAVNQGSLVDPNGAQQQQYDSSTASSTGRNGPGPLENQNTDSAPAMVAPSTQQTSSASKVYFAL